MPRGRGAPGGGRRGGEGGRLTRGSAAAVSRRPKKLPSIRPQHSKPPEESIFGAPAAEVRGLLQKVTPQSGSMAGVGEMLVSKEERHRTAWNDFTVKCEAISLSLQRDIKGAAEGFRGKLATSDGFIAERFATLDKDRVMVLEEDGVKKVLEDVEAEFPKRSGWIAEFNAEIGAKEGDRKRDMDELLYETLSAMVEIAHISEGEIQRAVEAEAMKLNREVLKNQRTYADLMRRLKIREIDLEKQKIEDWQAAMEQWRALRTNHTIKTFTDRIESTEFTEPADRLRLFEELRQDQLKAHDNMLEHIEMVTELLPPNAITPRSVQRWSDESTSDLDAWDAKAREGMGKVQDSEKALQEKAMRLYEELKADVRRYAAWPPDLQDQKLNTEAMSVVEERQAQAAATIRAADDFLQQQSKIWRESCSLLGGFLIRMAGRSEHHHNQLGALNHGVENKLENCRNAFNDADSERETNLENARAALKQGSSERALDEQVANALACLDTIEEGYRSFNTDMLRIVMQHPLDVANENKLYHWDLCDLLGLGPHVEKPAAEPAAEEPGEAAEGEASPEASNPPSPGKSEGAGTEGEEGPGSPGAPEEGAEEAAAPDLGNLVTEKGTEFVVTQDLYASIMAPVLRYQEAPAEEAAEEAEAAAEGEEGEAEAEAEAEAAPAEEGDGGEEAEEAEEEAAEPEDLVLLKPPTTLDGSTDYVSVLEIPVDVVSNLLTMVRGAMLDDLELITMESEQFTSMWSTEQEEILTEELDENLRSHRPRAGRIEEEDREHRSVELAAQKRKFDRHMRAINQFIKLEQDELEKSLERVTTELEGHLAKLQKAKDQLGTVASVKGLEIRGREISKLNSYTLDRIKSVCEALQSKAESVKDQFKEINERFVESLKTFEEGGLYNPAAVEATKVRLLTSNKQANRAVSVFERKVADLETSETEQVNAAMEAFESMLPPHREDLTLLEDLGHTVHGASSALRHEIVNSTSTATSIQEGIADLEKMASHEAEGSYLAIIEAAYKLRNLIHPRAKYLHVLESTIELKPLEIKLLQEAEGGEADGSADAPQDDAGEKRFFNEITEQIVQDCRKQLEERSENYYSAKDSSRDITRPDKIPPTVKELKEKNEDFLKSLHDQSEEHSTSAVTEFKGQILKLARILEKTFTVVLDGLVKEELDKLGREYAALRSNYDESHTQSHKLRTAHSRLMRPGLQNPNLSQELEDLCNKESERHTLSVEHIKECLEKVKGVIVARSTFFQAQLEHVVALWLKILDGCVLPQDIPEVSLEEAQIIKFKPMSMIKLRAIEAGQREEAVRTEVKERPFKLREWEGLPKSALSLANLGLGPKDLQDFYGADPEQDGEAADEAAEAGAPVPALETLCVRASINSRDKAFEVVRAKFAEMSNSLKEVSQERLSDEVKFKEDWDAMVELINHGIA